MNNYIDKQLLYKIYKSCNTKCPYCLSDVTLKDIQFNNFVFSETRRKQRKLAHRICVERNLRP